MAGRLRRRPAAGLTHARGHDRSQLAFAALALAFGVWLFWDHGGPRITAAGIYGFAFAAFVGFAGIWWNLQPDPVSTSLYHATMAGFFTTLAMWFVFWAGRTSDPAPIVVEDATVTSWLVMLGLCIAGLSVGVAQVSASSAVQVSLGGLALVTIGSVLHNNKGAPLRRLPIAAALVLLYFQLAFTGFGRLNLVALGLVALVAASMVATRRRAKSMLLVGALPAGVALVWLREQMTTDTGTQYDGLGSVVNPLHWFGELISLHGAGNLALADGNALAATLTVWVPRTWWPDKPSGFGNQSVPVLAPDTVDTNQSIAALAQGEWFWDFGWLGVCLMVVVLGALVGWIDRGIAARTAGSPCGRRDLLVLAILVLLASDMPNLVWGGTFGFTGRNLQRLALPLVLGLLFATRARVSRPDRRRAQTSLSASGRTWT